MLNQKNDIFVFFQSSSKLKSLAICKRYNYLLLCEQYKRFSCNRLWDVVIIK